MRVKFPSTGRIVSICSILLLVGCAGAVASVKGVIDSVTKTEPTSQTQRVRVQSDPTVFEAQTYLAQLGYDTGEPDGFMGPRTEDAIMLYRSDFGLPGEPAVDAELLNHLATTVQ